MTYRKKVDAFLSNDCLSVSSYLVLDRHGAREVAVVRLLDARPIAGRGGCRAVRDAVDDGHGGDVTPTKSFEASHSGLLPIRRLIGQQLTEFCESCVTRLFFTFPRVFAPRVRLGRPVDRRVRPRSPAPGPSRERARSCPWHAPNSGCKSRVESSPVVSPRKMGMR